MDFAANDESISGPIVEGFCIHALGIAAPIAIAVRSALLDLQHDYSDGSDPLLLVDSLIHKAAAEVWASHQILAGKLGRLTMFHHARALYEGHALAHWLFADFRSRVRRVLKETLLKRNKLENALVELGQPVNSDITASGRELLADKTVRLPPAVFDQAKSKGELLFDYAYFWKYSSAHVHPAHIQAAEINPTIERETIGQILTSIIRHSSGTFREIATYFNLEAHQPISGLAEAEAYGRYSLDLPESPS